MFEKFTDGARRAIFVARAEAIQRGAKEIEPAHLLLGILQQREIGPLFTSDPATLETIRGSIAQSLTTCREPLHEKTDIDDARLSHASKRILAYAAEESEIRHATIGSAHLLLGIHRESRSRQGGILNLFTQPPSIEAAILTEHGADYDTLRTRLAE